MQVFKQRISLFEKKSSNLNLIFWEKHSIVLYMPEYRATQEIVERDRALVDLEAELVKQQSELDSNNE